MSIRALEPTEHTGDGDVNYVEAKIKAGMYGGEFHLFPISTQNESHHANGPFLSTSSILRCSRAQSQSTNAEDAFVKMIEDFLRANPYTQVYYRANPPTREQAALRRVSLKPLNSAYDAFHVKAARMFKGLKSEKSGRIKHYTQRLADRLFADLRKMRFEAQMVNRAFKNLPV